MAEDKQYIQGLDEYIRQGEPQEHYVSVNAFCVS